MNGSAPPSAWKCLACQTIQLKISDFCTKCGAPALDAVMLDGRGTVASFTIVHRAPSAEFRRFLPYTIAIVELVEGVRVMARFAEPDQPPPRIGDVVRVSRQGRDDGTPLHEARLEIAGKRDE